LKHLYNFGDERIPEYWIRDVYFQYFCGGEKGIQINAYLAATAWNLKKMMEILKENFLNFIFRWFLQRKKCILQHNLNF